LFHWLQEFGNNKLHLTSGRRSGPRGKTGCIVLPILLNMAGYDHSYQ
jgi:hypothetical protein